MLICYATCYSANTYPSVSSRFCVDNQVSEPDPPQYDSMPESCQLLAQNTRLLRLIHRWSQEALAFEAGLDRSFISAIERCKRNVSLMTAEKIAKAFGLTLEELLGAHRAPDLGQRLLTAMEPRTRGKKRDT